MHPSVGPSLREEISLMDDDMFERHMKGDYSMSSFSDLLSLDTTIISGNDKPQVLSFTPISSIQQSSVDEKSEDMVVYLSHPVESLPPDSPVYAWYTMAAIIEVDDTSKSTLNFNNIHLTFASQLSPTTFSCNCSYVSAQKGHSMFILLIAVKQFVGANPICNGVLSFLEVLLAKSDSKELETMKASELALLHGNEDIKILSKMSDEAFKL